MMKTFFERNSILIEPVTFYEKTAVDIMNPDHIRPVEPDTQDREVHHAPIRGRFHTSRQILRFALAGGLNTLLDLLVLNSLLWL
jgi:hypothetical protein